MTVAAATFRAWPLRDANGRTNQKLRRGSREALAREPVEHLSPRQRRERIAAFRRHATAVRIPGKRRGHGATYSAIAGDVLDYLMFHAVQTGRVFPSYEQISEAVGCAYRTAVRVIRQLEGGGWLSWERRFVRIGAPGVAEPQVEQTSNFYRLHLPTIAGELIKAWRARRPPPPDDAPPALTADQEAAADTEKRLAFMRAAMVAARTPEEREALEKHQTRLAAVLERLRLGIEQAGPPGEAAPKREFP